MKSRNVPNRLAQVFLIVVLAYFVPLIAGQEQAASENGEASKRSEPVKSDTGLDETVVVTAARSPQLIGDATALVSVLSASDIQRSPSMLLDQKLASVPGFSLFRRSSSMTSHPTTQGVSLRGIGPSGASRSLVLLDGIPMNDPFGGWVYWNRIPSVSLERVEISRGAGSQLYGSSALGGTIQLLTRRVDNGEVDIRLSGGQHESFQVEALGSGRHGPLGYVASGGVFGTGGVWVVDADERGKVDRPVSVDFQNLLGKLYYKDFHVGVNLFHENRGNGTELQTNSSQIMLLETGFTNEQWNVAAYTQSGVLESQFSRILPGRDREFPTSFQRYESQAFGAAVSYQASRGLTVGSDWRYVGWDASHQNLWGAFVQQILPAGPRVDLQLGLRFDVWENEAVQTAVNPRLGVLYRASDFATLRASAYKGFRAPTLNELYRPFRVGNVMTMANAALGAEQLWGFEGGVDLHPAGSFMLRLNGFRNRLVDPVSNVTLEVTEDLILRQRQNLGHADVNGLEADARWRLGDHWSVTGAYLLSDSRVSGSQLRLPQVPLNQASLGLEYSGPLLVSVAARILGNQFEDDLNEFVLDRFGVLDIHLSVPVGSRLEAFISVDNTFDQRYVVGKTPIDRLGEPRMIYGGLRLAINR